jgi:hypothetical protein
LGDITLRYLIKTYWGSRMGVRRISREEAEEAYTASLVGAPLDPEDPTGPKISAVVLPEEPTPGGSEGIGFLPLTYEYANNGATHTLITASGPGVEEARRFLSGGAYGDVEDPVLLWFEIEP